MELSEVWDGQGIVSCLTWLPEGQRSDDLRDGRVSPDPSATIVIYSMSKVSLPMVRGHSNGQQYLWSERPPVSTAKLTLSSPGSLSLSSTILSCFHFCRLISFVVWQRIYYHNCILCQTQQTIVHSTCWIRMRALESHTKRCKQVDVGYWGKACGSGRSTRGSAFVTSHD